MCKEIELGLKNTGVEYGSIAKALHWLIAIGIFAIIYLGLQQDGMERGDARSQIRFIHSSIATITLILMTFRIVWRFLNEVPSHPLGMPAWQRLSSTVVHWGLYITVFAQLIAGAMMAGTGGKGIPVFNFFTIPIPVLENHDAHEWWEGVHKLAWIPIAVLLSVHVLGALYNHFIVKNDVVRRMTLGLK